MILFQKVNNLNLIRLNYKIKNQKIWKDIYINNCINTNIKNLKKIYNINKNKIEKDNINKYNYNIINTNNNIIN